MNILSVVASCTPFSDFNQSPRNMYQCQMGKQTMGVPVHAFQHRCDNKLYRLNTMQKAIVRTKVQNEYCMDDYPTGANAVVAVLAYTGYDMEDACIINKSSYERGMYHSSIYMTKYIDLTDDHRLKGGHWRFDNRFFFLHSASSSAAMHHDCSPSLVSSK